MKQFPAFLLIVLLVLVAASCKKNSSSGSRIPHISLVGMEPNHAKISEPKDTVLFFFNVTDGDADIGLGDNQNDIFFLDNRQADTSNLNIDTLKFSLPDIPAEAVNPDKGLEGSFIVPVPSGFLHTRTDTTAKDTVIYEVYIIDKAGNQSNHVTTPAIYLEQ